MIRSDDYLAERLVYDAWCAAFVWAKTAERTEVQLAPLTQAVFGLIRSGAKQVDPTVCAEIRRLAKQYRFFHWHLAFPEVFHRLEPGEIDGDDTTGWTGGFDVVLGNPPWDRIKLQEQEWFAARSPEIATAPNAAARKRRIADLKISDPVLYQAFQADLRAAEGESQIVRHGGRFPLCGRGDVNTYSIFAETMRLLLNDTGRVGCVIPSGIATDDTTKFLFQDLVRRQALVNLYDFENRRDIFEGVGHGRFKFCLLTLTGSARPAAEAEFVFFAYEVDDLRQPDRRFTLSAADLALLNPNTGTAAIFRSRPDAELTKAIYRRVPVLIAEGPPECNPWGIRFMTMFHMANDSGLFKTWAELEAEGWRLVGNRWVRDTEVYLPLYEAKMIHHFDHRFGDYRDQPAGSESTHLPDIPLSRRQDPDYSVLPRYWVPVNEVEARLQGRWQQGWLLGWRDICRSTDERTVIASLVPRVGVGHTMPLMLIQEAEAPLAACLLANLNSFVLDYVARQKIGGTHLTYGYLSQLPILSPRAYQRPCPWQPAQSLQDWITERVLALVYTAWDIRPFALECAYAGPPHAWDERQHVLIRAELDACYAHLYGLNRDDFAYVLDTFPIVHSNDRKRWGEERTKRLVLEAYDRMAEAMRTGVPYQTRLDPPPADPRVTHQPTVTVVDVAARRTVSA